MARPEGGESAKDNEGVRVGSILQRAGEGSAFGPQRVNEQEDVGGELSQEEREKQKH